ncbi:insulinase family protein [Photorhabdus laumondii]|uniref:Peptidase M16 n=1 Tax=Photorhabdus laumondii subsp. clarkei TaxID=2029685 RepID=A0A329VD56_9GAMM|nr:insulinase family protein [Photorhabdus laumondii]RAW87466.1 peptidase M16 [Photorhabdus laumondii subsp. clarkei]
MQGTKIRYFIGGIMLAVAGQTQAEALQPDPAWKQGKLENGFNWQILQTPQRPNDRIQLRLVVKTGSLAEKTQQAGYTWLIPKVVLFSSKSLSSTKLEQLWNSAIDPKYPLPPAIVSYDFTLYSLSLPHNQPELLKDALNWLADAAGKAVFTPETLQHAMKMADTSVATYPPDIQDPVWRRRLKGSTLLGHDPAQNAPQPIDLERLKQFYRQWYTPDMMTLYVAGHVDSRTLPENISLAFSSLKGKRHTPATIAALSPMKPETIGIISDKKKEDTLSLIWDLNWQPINDSHVLNHYWISDITREALYRYLQLGLERKNDKALKLGLDCKVQYHRASCALNLNTTAGNLKPAMEYLAAELVTLRDKGLPKGQFDELYVQKQAQLSQLFAMYAHTSTDILINQRLLSQQSNVVDIAPEQYQRLRQAFLASLTPEMLNRELKQILSQEVAFILIQPKGEAEMDVDQLRNSFNQIMSLTPHKDKVDIPAQLPMSKSEAKAS